jgi:hypothetical protein
MAQVKRSYAHGLKTVNNAARALPRQRSRGYAVATVAMLHRSRARLCPAAGFTSSRSMPA